MGRWALPERFAIDDRKCKLCNKLEDEYHFVLLYDAIRTQYIVRYYLRRPSMFKLIEFVSSKSKTQVKNL